MYGIFSSLYVRPPDEALIEQLRDLPISKMSLMHDAFSATLTAKFGRVEAWFQQMADRSSREISATLSIEFTRLFRGLNRVNSPPPPYESVYIDNGILYGPSTDKVKARLDKFGLKPATGEPPDHVAMELEFMRFLCVNEGAAWRKEKQGRQWLEEELSFITEHLLNWVPQFCSNVRKFDNTGFYKALADAAEGWIDYDRTVIEGLLDSQKP